MRLGLVQPGMTKTCRSPVPAVGQLLTVTTGRFSVASLITHGAGVGAWASV